MTNWHMIIDILGSTAIIGGAFVIGLVVGEIKLKDWHIW